MSLISPPQIATEAEGRPWSEETSSAKNYHAPGGMGRSATTSTLQSHGSGYSSVSQPRNISGGGGGGRGMVECHSDLESWLNEPGQKARTEDFFNRKMNENSSRPR